MKRTLNITLAACMFAAGTMFFASCGNNKKAEKTETTEDIEVTTPEFNADSAYAYCKAQCDFGPRPMNTPAHEECGQWIVDKFTSFGCNVIKQQATLKGYDGTPLKATNIIAEFNPAAKKRIMFCAHWDSRPWADNDDDENNHKTPIIAANDGASGVAVMLEIARTLSQNKGLADDFGVDFICFDAEDWGTPQWEDSEGESDVWALGSQYWSKNLHKEGYNPKYGILLDMVGGMGSKFYREGVSEQFAPHVTDKVMKAAQELGYGSIFINELGGMVTDDHYPINTIAKIPTADVIAFYPESQKSSFGDTWHTVNDTMDFIDKNILKAVGQTMIQIIYTEKQYRKTNTKK